MYAHATYICKMENNYGAQRGTLNLTFFLNEIFALK